MTAESGGLVARLLGKGLLRDRPMAVLALEGVESVRCADGEERLVCGRTGRRAPEGLRHGNFDGVKDWL